MDQMNQMSGGAPSQGPSMGPAMQGPSMPPQGEKKMMSWWVIIAVVAVLVLLGAGYWWWQQREASAPAGESAQVAEPSQDSMALQAEGVDLGNIDEEFQEVDADLKQL